MKNLWLFFVRYNAFFWFIFFFSLAFVFIIRNNNYQKTAYFNSSNVIVGTFYANLNHWKSYLALNQVNEDLAQENAFLREQLQRFLLTDNLQVDTLQDSLNLERYLFIPATIANNSIHQKNNFITLNKGSNDGLEKGMGVIAPNGVVGIILNVSENFSSVQSLLHTDTRISVVLDSTEVFGSLVWGDNTDARYAMVRDIPNHVIVEEGQNIYTSGFSLFPEGIKVGEIIETGITSGESFLEARIKLTTDFSALHHVYVIKDLLGEEKEKLEIVNSDE